MSEVLDKHGDLSWVPSKHIFLKNKWTNKQHCGGALDSRCHLWGCRGRGIPGVHWLAISPYLVISRPVSVSKPKRWSMHAHTHTHTHSHILIYIKQTSLFSTTPYSGASEQHLTSDPWDGNFILRPSLSSSLPTLLPLYTCLCIMPYEQLVWFSLCGIYMNNNVLAHQLL
jgi:hypothetical protein